MKLYIQLHLDIMCCWLDFDAYRSRKSIVVRNFLFLTQWYSTKLHAIVPNMNYFKPVILKFKTFIYNSNNKIMHNFVYLEATLPPVRVEVNPQGEFFFLLLVFLERTPQNRQNFYG